MKPLSKIVYILAKISCATITLLFIFMTSGCANYKYMRGVNPYGDGYIVLRNNTVISEYTIGRDNKAPQDLNLAKERFKERRTKVEYYYKKMDILYTPLKTFISYPFSLVGAIVGIFKLPFIIVSDYRYEHNPEYKKKIDTREAQKKKKENEQRQKLQDELSTFIERELAIEGALGTNIK